VSTRAKLSEAERARIADAIRAAEVNTAGEIYVVVAGEAAEFHSIPVLWAALIALIVPWPLFLLTALPSWIILLLQVLAFVVIATAASHHRIRHRIVPPSIAGAAARKAAQAQFMAHGVHLTEARTGVLIYVALADRRVEIVADDGINRKVAQSELDQLAQDVVAAARAGVLAEGLVVAVNDAGKLLSRHFPPTAANPNELPNRVVEI
jgi:putative membrane protein